MKDCGIGTPATRASIIETLFKRGYMERCKKLLPANRKYGAGGKKIILNMPGRQVAFWINMVIPFVVDV